MINVRLKASELVKAGFAFGLGMNLSIMTISFVVGVLGEIVRNSAKKGENEEKETENCEKM